MRLTIRATYVLMLVIMFNTCIHIDENNLINNYNKHILNAYNIQCHFAVKTLSNFDGNMKYQYIHYKVWISEDYTCIADFVLLY